MRSSTFRLVLSLYLPTLLAQLGQALGDPYLPLYARDMGSTLAMAAVIPSLGVLGIALMDLPGGWVVNRLGERRAMILGGCALLGALVLRSSTNSLGGLAASALFFGMGNSLWWLARSAWMKREFRSHSRGKAMSMMGGMLRIARLLGPFAGGALAEFVGYHQLYFVQTGLTATAVALVVLFLIDSPETPVPYAESLKAAATRWKERPRTIAMAAMGIGGLTLLRTARATLLPLWGAELGLGESLIGIVETVGGLADMALFWLSGVIVTRWGRKASAVACTFGLATALGLMPLAVGFWSLLGIAILAGVGNALGAGINLTISGDLAPRESPAAFLSVWRFVMGLGGTAGPALAALVVQWGNLTSAPLATAAVGLGSATLMALWMGEPSSAKIKVEEKI